MVTPVPILVRWLSPQEGGRQSGVIPFSGYCVPVIVDPKNAWSFRLVSIDEPIRPLLTNATGHFLFEEAPHDYLVEGRRFNLCEGARIVGRVLVIARPIQPGDPIPEI